MYCAGATLYGIGKYCIEKKGFIVKSILKAGVVALAMASVGGYAAEAKTCKPVLRKGVSKAIATKVTRSQLKNRAVAVWEVNVRKNVGLGWSQWQVANAKSQKCHRTGVFLVCIAAARPCKP